MKKLLLLFVMILLPMVASAYDIAIPNADGVTIYYNQTENNELEVTYNIKEQATYSGTVNIPESVSYTGKQMSVTAIGDSAFYGCHKLNNVIIPQSVTYIRNYAFYMCIGLTSIIIPNKVVEIGRYSFCYCQNLTSINIPKSVTAIRRAAFYSCKNLSTVIIPESVTVLDNMAFQKCTSLYEITIPKNTNVGSYAFEGCESLIILTLEKCNLGTSAFNNCPLKTIICKSDYPTPINGSTFSVSIYYNAKVWIPKGAMTNYKNTTGWKDFHKFFEEGTSTTRCAKPTISYINNKLIFSSSTNDVNYKSEIVATDNKTYSNTNEISLTATYYIYVYAQKDGYEDSPLATAILCWIDQTPKTEGITNGVANIPANAVLIQSNGGVLTIQGIDDGIPVNVYSINGTQAGSAVGQNGQATIDTSLQPGSVAIVKIGKKSVKVVVK